MKIVNTPAESPTGRPRIPPNWALPLFLIGCLALALDKAGVFPQGSTGAKLVLAVVEFIGLLGLLSAGWRIRGGAALLVLCLTLTAPLVQAQEAAVFDAPTRARLTGDAEMPRLADYLSLQASGGVALRGGHFRPLVTGLGLVHLAKFGGQGPILSAALGGQAVLGDVQDLGFFGGLALDLPGLPGQRVQPSLALGAGYSSGSAFGLSLPGWFGALMLGFRMHPGG